MFFTYFVVFCQFFVRHFSTLFYNISHYLCRFIKLLFFMLFLCILFV
nr:MAG TPA: hypothetical protein [Bacteriophage sp.]